MIATTNTTMNATIMLDTIPMTDTRAQLPVHKHHHLSRVYPRAVPDLGRRRCARMSKVHQVRDVQPGMDTALATAISIQMKLRDHRIVQGRCERTYRL